LVTIVGPGGIGKTQVAVSLARLLVEEFEAGVYLLVDIQAVYGLPRADLNTEPVPIQALRKK
jgi:anion-transporting  ArsA/GET3 family ATPase